MNASNGKNGAQTLFSISLPAGFEATWAGSLSDGRVFCFGSETGDFLLTNAMGQAFHQASLGSMSREAINGVAYIKTWLAVTTREEITFIPTNSDVPNQAVPVGMPHGAHGVTSSAGGFFVAALGRSGILVVSPPISAEKEITVYGSPEDGIYHYRAGCVSAGGGREFLLTAMRRNGLGWGEFSGGTKSHTMTTASSTGLDIIDFCPLHPGDGSLAIAVLSSDRKLLLFKDILTAKASTFDFKTIEGTAYRVFSCRGDVYVVTSLGVYMLAGFADAFMFSSVGEKIDTQVMVTPMRAVDANMCGDKWVLVVTGDGVIRMDLQAMREGQEQKSIAHSRESQSVSFDRNVSFGELRQANRTLAFAF